MQALVVAALAAVALLEAQPGRPQARHVELVPLAPAKLTHCRRTVLLRAACPRLVPRVRAEYLNHLAVEGEGTRLSLATFNLERGAQYPDQPERNRPPRMAHLLVVGGHVERSAAGVFDNLRRAALRDGLMRRKRTRSLDLGARRWAGRSGRLLLAPEFPNGGMHGNHLIFRWRDGGREYVLSLHGWEPLTEAAATLEAVVSSARRS